MGNVYVAGVGICLPPRGSMDSAAAQGSTTLTRL